MNWRNKLFNLILSISRAKHKYGDTVYKTRANYKLMAKTIYYLSRKPKDVRVEYSTREGFPSIRLIPEKKSSRVILYIYGGSFVMKFRIMQYPSIPFAATLAKASESEVWVPSYRVAPEFGFPTQIEDSVHSYKTLLAKGVDPSDITIMGTGSGANMALATVLYIKEKGLPLPGSVATISAWADLTMTNSSHEERARLDPVFNIDTLRGYFNHYLQGGDPKNPLASPYFGDFTGFPPLYMMVGGREIFYDDTIKTAQKAEAAGVDVTLDAQEDMIFSYPIYYEFIEGGKDAIQRLANFVKENNSQSKASNQNRLTGNGEGAESV